MWGGGGKAWADYESTSVQPMGRLSESSCTRLHITWYGCVREIHVSSSTPILFWWNCSAVLTTNTTALPFVVRFECSNWSCLTREVVVDVAGKTSAEGIKSCCTPWLSSSALKLFLSTRINLTGYTPEQVEEENSRDSRLTSVTHPIQNKIQG